MKDPTVCTHLAKRGNRYSLRRKIPTDLQERYGGRIEIVKALGTSDRREAERLCRVAGAALDEEFQKARDDIARAKAPAVTPPPPPRVNADEVASHTLAALRHRRDSVAQQGYAELEAFMEQQRVNLANQEAILRGDMVPDHPLSKHEGWRNAIRTFLAGDGIVKELPVAPPPDFTTPPTTHAGEQDSVSSDTLTGVLDKWVLERQPEKRTVAKAALAVKRFTESQGKLLASRYTARHVVAFKDKLLADGQTPINTNKQLEQLSILFNYARKNLLIPSNPAEGIRVQVSKRAKEARLPFEEEHLRQFFAGPVHAKGDRPAPGAGEAAYWLPLLSLYSGARVEELAQLGPNDVYQESYTDSDGTARTAWVIAVTDEGDGQAVKNAGSRRRFPVHQDLIRLGFIDFIDPIKATGRTRVFDKLIPDVMGAESGNWAKWFSKYLRGVIGITDKRRVFHSFRHTFKAISRACEIPEDIHDAITGHSSASVARSYGGTDYPLRPLVEAMKRYKPPSLGLPIKPSI